MHQSIERLSAHLYQSSVDLVAMLERNISRLAWGWLVLVALAAVVRLTFPASAIDAPMRLAEALIPYLLVGIAPLLAFALAGRAFPRGLLLQQPTVRLARYGRWQAVDILRARSSIWFGPTGLMASLLLGILLNVPVRTVEFLLAVPAMNANAPLWGQTILAVMTFDVAVMNFLYVAVFVAALRCSPWFPRLMLAVWGVDMASQIGMAHIVAASPGLPQNVASAMSALLYGNLQKVFISAAIWLPYLLLSQRVNLTYRLRTPAVAV